VTDDWLTTSFGRYRANVANYRAPGNLELFKMNREGLLKGYLICDDCHLAKEDVKDVMCPYDRDVNNMDTPALLCDMCYGERCDEI
jgi:hypothetical protein